MKTLYIFIIAAALCATASAQQIFGRVFEVIETDTLALTGAHVFPAGSQQHGTLTGPDGRFALELNDGETAIVVSHVSYKQDTIEVTGTEINIYLRSGRTLDEVVVTARAPDTYLDNGPVRTEIITSQELTEAACCDLAGCFNRTASVDRAVTDVLSDTKELRMFSLAGVYTQILVDNIPWMTNGLNQNFAVQHIPGTMISQIMVMKGLNSVLQGGEAVSGQINVLTKQVEEGQGTLVNAFANSFLETQYNLNYSAVAGDWSTIVVGHTTQHGQEIDGDGDSFMDMPTTTRYMGYNKWTYTSEENKMRSYIAAKFIDEERIGGQRGFNHATDMGTMNRYGQVLDMQRLEAYSKTEKEVAEGHFMDLLLSFSTHRLDGWYGTTAYAGSQQTLYGDVRYEFKPAEENQLTLGAGFRSLTLQETVTLGLNPHNKTYGGNYLSTERIAGVFVEDMQNFFDDDLTFIGGLRVDNHSGEGVLYTPRLHVKYAFSDFTALRGSVGMGNRTAHVFAENLSLLASSRNILIDSDIAIERALNYGVNLSHEYSAFGIDGTFGLDLYRTEFMNQIRPVYDENPTLIHFRNLEGRSYSNSMTAELSAILSMYVDAKFAWTFSELYEEQNGVRTALPFVPKHKLLGTLSWSTLEPDWRVDVTAQWLGKQRLPNTASYPEQYRMADYSDPYTILGFQVTKNWEYFDIYAGVDNLLNERQKNPIIGADNPFGQYFEPTFVWGDVKGREAYMGIRWRLFRAE